MFIIKYLAKKKTKKEILSPDVKEQLDGLHVMLEERYGQGFADSIMKPYMAIRDKDRH